jgi:hypothetical protein
MSTADTPGTCPMCGGTPPLSRGELTREQHHIADALALQYGRVVVMTLPSGRAILRGLTDDIERELVVVEPDGTRVDV